MSTITKDMIINDILNVDEGLAPILMQSGMPCLGCLAASGETLEQAAGVHGVDVDSLEAKLNEYLANRS